MAAIPARPITGSGGLPLADGWASASEFTAALACARQRLAEPNLRQQSAHNYTSSKLIEYGYKNQLRFQACVHHVIFEVRLQFGSQAPVSSALRRQFGSQAPVRFSSSSSVLTPVRLSGSSSALRLQFGRQAPDRFSG